MTPDVRAEIQDLLVKHHGSNPNLDRWLAAVTAPDPRPAEEPDREALARVENLVMRLVAEAHRKYPEAGVHWVNADDLTAALAALPSGEQQTGEEERLRQQNARQAVTIAQRHASWDEMRRQRDEARAQVAAARRHAFTEAWQAVDHATRPLGYGDGASNSPWNEGYEQATNKALNAILALRNER
jgi:hypothetical protein